MRKRPRRNASVLVLVLCEGASGFGDDLCMALGSAWPFPTVTWDHF
jgi:hypothetical protein